MLAWLADPEHAVRPHRVADIVAIGKGSKVYDGLVDLDEEKIVKWELTEDVQPLVRTTLMCPSDRKLTVHRSRWRICRWLNILPARTPRLSSNVD